LTWGRGGDNNDDAPTSQTSAQSEAHARLDRALDCARFADATVPIESRGDYTHVVRERAPAPSTTTRTEALHQRLTLDFSVFAFDGALG
jgi:hypothetical protein